MAPLPPTPTGVIRVILQHQVGTDANAVDSIYFQYSGSGVTTAGLQSLASAIQGYWVTDLSSLYHTTQALSGVECIDLQNPSTPAGAWAGSHPGTRSNQPLTGETAVLINNKIARRYRGGKPRIYLPAGEANDLQSPQAWSTTFISAMQSGWNAFIAAIVSFPGPPAMTSQCSVSYFHGSTWHQNSVTGAWKRVATPRATPVIDPVTATVVNPKPGSQRRRMVR